MSSTGITNSGLSEETHEYVWAIPNHVSVVSSAESLSGAVKLFTVNSRNGVTYKWQLGYKAVGQERYTPYLKLVSPTADNHIIPVKWTLFCTPIGEGDWKLFSEYKMQTRKPICEYPDITIPKSEVQFPLNGGFSLDWGETFWWKSQLVVLVRDRPAQATAEFQTESIKNLQSNLVALLSDSKSADLTIICSDGVELHAHKLILSANNAVFALMLKSDMTERNTSVLKLDDISSSTMKILLHYFYTGSLQDEWKKPEPIVEFTYAAGKYQLTDVLNLLNYVLLNYVLGTFDHKDRTVALLRLADKLGLKTAEKELFDRVKDSINKILKCKDLFAMFE